MTARRLLTGTALSVGAVAAVTGVVYAFRPSVPILSLGVLYLLAVLPVAVVWGRVFAIAVAIASVTKPFGIDELLGGLRAALRRASPASEPVVEIGDLRIDLALSRGSRSTTGPGLPWGTAPWPCSGAASRRS